MSLKDLFEREYGLKVFIKDLKNEWNELIEEAKIGIGEVKDENIKR